MAERQVRAFPGIAAAPAAHVQAFGPDIDAVKTGQKLVIYSILLNIGTVFVFLAVGSIALCLPIIAVGLAHWGMCKMASGFRYGLGKKILLLVLMVVPLVNLITLLVVNGRATRVLRGAGLKVGLLGAA